MMKFLANENFPLKSVSILRNSVYDVRSITEDSPGITDEQVLRQAVHEHRIILTFDRDYISILRLSNEIEYVNGRSEAKHIL